MKFEDIKHVSVIGAGDMGHGIAQVALMTGYTVTMYDIEDEYTERGKGRIEWSMGKLVEKARISEKERDQFLANLSLTTDIAEAVKNADLCIEAAPEIIELKKEIFGNLDKFSPKHAILGTNTSNMSIDEIATATNRPEKVVGLHFFNPPVMMQLVEITKGEKTSDETVDLMVKLTKAMTKDPIVCRKDSPGFIVNRINAPTMLYLAHLLDRKLYEPAGVDAAAMNMGMRMGPYELMDFVGLDILYHSMKYLETRLSKDYTPTPTMEKLMKEKKLGKKTGEGFYKWPETGRPDIDPSKPADDFDLMDMLRVQINEAAKVVEEGLCTAKEVDIGMKKGMNNPFGPFEMAENADLEELTKFMDGLADKFGLETFRAHDWIRNGTIMEKAKGEVKKEEEVKSEFEFDAIEIQKDPENFTTTIYLNNPPVNTIGAQMLDDLDNVLDILVDDLDTRVIVLRGKANCFSAGADLAGGIPDSAWNFKKYVTKGQHVFKRFRDIPKPVIAAIERYAFGGGLEISMNCDLRYAKKSAKVGLTEVTLGLIPGWGGTQLMVKHLGVGKTMELTLTGERIKAKRAFKMGLINGYFDDDEFEEEVYKIAHKIAHGCSPIAVGIAKQMVNYGAQVPLDIGLAMESYGAGLVFSTEDLQEGIFAFMGKRKPEFKNQ